MKTLLALAATALLTTGALAATYPSYADMNRDGMVTADEYQTYAFERADADDDGFIDDQERWRFDRLMRLDQEF